MPVGERVRYLRNSKPPQVTDKAMMTSAGKAHLGQNAYQYLDHDSEQESEHRA